MKQGQARDDGEGGPEESRELSVSIVHNDLFNLQQNTVPNNVQYSFFQDHLGHLKLKWSKSQRLSKDGS